MKKIKNNVFLGLSLRMIGFGVCVGIFFPFFCVLFGVDRQIAFSYYFFMACVLAGILVGLINYMITRGTVGKKLKVLTEKMTHVNQRVLAYDFSDSKNPCSEKECLIHEDSEDEFGVSANAFNTMVRSLVQTLQFQSQHRAFVEKLTANLDLESLSNFAMQSLIDFSGASAGAILVEREGELILTAHHGIINPESLTENRILLTTLKTGNPARIEFPENLLLDGVITAFRPSQLVVQPIRFAGAISGMVVLASQQYMEKDFLDQLDIFVYDLSLVLDNSLQHDQIQKLAVLDSLTGIYNRRFGLERLKEEYARSLRSNAPLGVIMMDLDRFKLVNDTYGHIAGDLLLRQIVVLTKPILRKGDIFVRYGGEEFLAIMPGASVQDVVKIAERIRFAVSENVVDYNGAKVKATMSLGVDSFPSSEIDEPMQLIANADAALYRAKNGGRNKTVVFEKTSVSYV